MSNMMAKKLAFIGGGQMAEAIIGGLLTGQLCKPESLWASDPVAARCDRLKSQFGIRVGCDNHQAVSWAEVVILAVKPQTMPDVLHEVGAALGRTLVISIAAGVTIRSIGEQAAGAKRIVRAMPNTPALVREGMTALAFGEGISEDDKGVARTVFEAVGRVVPVEERLMDAVTGLSGSGPAYVFTFIEALSDAGVKNGLTRDVSTKLALQTVLGAAREHAIWLARASGHEVIDEHADVGLASLGQPCFPASKGEGGIDARHQSLPSVLGSQ